MLAAGTLVAMQAPAQGDDDALFKARCGECHTVEKLAPGLARRGLPARERYLERFLQRHYAPDADERRRIIAWLGTQVGAGK